MNVHDLERLERPAGLRAVIQVMSDQTCFCKQTLNRLYCPTVAQAGGGGDLTSTGSLHKE